jgi:membrane-associated protein
MTLLLIPLLYAWGSAAVLLLVGIVFVESGLLLGFFLPGDSLLFTAGVLVAAGVIHLPVWLVVTAVAAAAVAGDQVGYLLGRRFGPRAFSRTGSRFLSPKHVDRAASFVARYGALAVMLARFTPVLRTLTPVVAGVGAMPRRRFTLYNLAGGIAWAAATVLAGFFLGGVPLVATHVELVVLSIVVLSLVPTAIAVLGGHRRKCREPRPSEQRLDPCAEEALRAAFACGRHPGQTSEPTPTERPPRSPSAGRSPGPER